MIPNTFQSPLPEFTHTEWNRLRVTLAGKEGEQPARVARQNAAPRAGQRNKKFLCKQEMALNQGFFFVLLEYVTSNTLFVLFEDVCVVK